MKGEAARTDMLPVIQAWLTGNPPLPLYRDAPDHSLDKAALLPFIRARELDDWLLLLMRPVSTKPELGTPPLQICKGTRIGFTQGEWKDIGRNDTVVFEKTETLVETALREGFEELGVRPQAFSQLYDLGDVSFSSASTSAVKAMRLFAGEMQAADALEPFSAIAAATAERKWMSLVDFNQTGRPDHVAIINQAIAEISALL